VTKKAGFSDTGQLNVAVVGLGWWGKTMIEFLKDSPTVKVVMAVDVVPASAEWVKSQGLEFASDYNAALADPNIGGVILCTPHTMHTQQIAAAAKAKKHVFCEKPLALVRSEAAASVAACKAAGVVLGVGHEHRFKPVTADILKMVRSGELGKIQFTEATMTFPWRPMAADNWRLQKAEAPGGVSMTAMAVHAVELSIAVNGPAQSVVANMRSIITETNNETLGILLSFKNGANGVVCTANGPPFSIRFAVFGSKGWVEVHDIAHPMAPEGWVLTKAMQGTPAVTVEYPSMPLVRANVEAFADAAAGRAPYPITGDEMVANIAAFEAICKSAESRQIEMVEG
jgi:predicted dehydrogenase